MNGVHDMGGMHGVGRIPYEPDEPVFHEPWEGRVFALNLAMRAWRKWNIDAGRYEIELIPPAEYLRMSWSRARRWPPGGRPRARPGRSRRSGPHACLR